MTWGPLQKKELPDTESTLGVEVKEGMKFDNPAVENCSVTANLWDFGGQEIQYQLHQYFITPDSLYILVADNRKQHTRWDYWFQIISLFGGKCPVLVVLNNNRIHSNDPNFPFDKCKENFPQLCMDSAKIDFNVNDGNWTVLQQKIRNELSVLPMVNKEVPKLWKPLREALTKEKKQTNYISIDRFFELCPDGLDKEKHRLEALEYFHRIGIVLHFGNDANLSDIVFLNPNWITQGIYAALSGVDSDCEQGIFSEKWIYEFWEKHENKYKYNERAYLLRLMLKDKFDLCYKIGDDRYLVPMLLPDKQPDHDWICTDNLGFRIQYPFMPEGIISRFIVRMHQYVDDNLIWLDGAVLNNSRLNCRAQIIRRKDYRSGLMYIDINICGESINNRKEFLLEIRNEIYHIHDSSFKKIPFTELVVCNCEKCSNLAEPHFYSLNELKEYLSEGKSHIECRRLKDKVSINQLLGNVYSDEEIERIIRSSMNMEPERESKAVSDSEKQVDLNIKEKRANTLTALIPVSVVFVLLVGSIILFSYFNIGIEWFVTMIITILLLIPSIWTYTVSPGSISEKSAIAMFDKIFRNYDLLSKLLNMFSKFNGDKADLRDL